MINNKNGLLIFADTDQPTVTKLPQGQVTELAACTSSAGNTFSYIVSYLHNIILYLNINSVTCETYLKL